MTLALWRAYPYYLWPRFGWTAATGVALLLIAMIVQSVLVPELQAKANQAKHALQLAQVVVAPTAAEVAQKRQMNWLSTLPLSREALNTVDSIHSAALRHGLRLAHGEYHWVQDPAPQYLRYQMVFPVHGRYADIQAWLAESLNANSTLALEGWSVSRDTLTSEELDGIVHFTLYTGVQ